MIITSRWRRSATILTALAAVLLPAAAPAAAATTTPAAGTVTARRELPDPPPVDAVRAELTVEAQHTMAGYSRDRFPHWIKISGECDTRESVLARDGQDVAQDDLCRAVSGTWTSRYDNKTFTDAKALDIDHVVPLAAAWRSGADTWTTAKRRAFANDLTHSQLIAVSAASNRSKGDKSPDAWRPPATDYWCTYSRAWTDTKHIYSLSVTEPEKAALNSMLDTCP